MQNIPNIVFDRTSKQVSMGDSSCKKEEHHSLFADLFNKHSKRVEDKLALTPLSTQEKMIALIPEAGNKVQHEAKTTEARQINSAEQELRSHSTEAQKTEERLEEQTKEQSTRDRDQKMTHDDFEEVRDDLEEYGLSEKEIEALEDRVESEEGLTWSEFVTVLSGKMKQAGAAGLSDEQKKHLNAFFAQFGITPKESAKLIAQLEHGEADKVLSALQKKLDGMSGDKKFSFTQQGIHAFGEALNASEELKKQLKELLGKTLPNDIKNVFASIGKELASKKAHDTKFVTAIGSAFVEAMKKKHMGATSEEHGDAFTRQANTERDFLATQTESVAQKALKDRGNLLPEKNAEHAKQKVLSEQINLEAAHNEENNDADKHWTHFFNKLQKDTPDSQVGARGNFKTETIESMLKAGVADANTQAKLHSKTQMGEKISEPKLMKQVENAFIKTLANGTKQLSLQLTPDNLGKLNILLQVNGKEVNATIKAESPEAARVISENLDILKTSLENQGLKVDKLDVQTGLTDHQSSENWFGSNEHNLAREREIMVAMRAHMNKMREESDGLAQEMQNETKQARHADQGLHVIA